MKHVPGHTVIDAKNCSVTGSAYERTSGPGAGVLVVSPTCGLRWEASHRAGTINLDPDEAKIILRVQGGQLALRF